MKQLSMETLREQVIGIDAPFETPFGQRLLLYGDFTASGRCLAFIESYLLQLQRHYANTHTEDDMSGRSMTQLMHRAMELLKGAVHAGPEGRVLAVGAGSTAAIDKLGQILGIMMPPATKKRILAGIRGRLGDANGSECEAAWSEARPVVFVGPYEHHSNEVTWRNGLAEVVEVDESDDGGIDLDSLETLLEDPRFEGRQKIGSFSAASNVTGRLSPVHDIARILHAHDAIACFDYAASAPYVSIDMNPGPDPDGADPSLDAIFLSPHKFLGGPGSSGLLIFRSNLYDPTLPPTVAGGGTVSYVGPQGEDFEPDIEVRESAGTPGVLQFLKAALAFEVKESIGVEQIEARDRAYLEKALSIWEKNERIRILGNPDPKLRLPIVSFLIEDPLGGQVHPRLLTVLLNDLFGIQSRAGCSCAGPYGHRLLGIGSAEADQFRGLVRQGLQGIKPGWCRIGFHYAFDDADADYIIDAVDFLGTHASEFLRLYDFDLRSGAWSHRTQPVPEERFSLEDAMQAGPTPNPALPIEIRRSLYQSWLDEARQLVDELPGRDPDSLPRLPGEAGDLQWFQVE